MQQLLDSLQQQLLSAENIAIFWHESIDGDALGAMLGLGKLLEKQGKKMNYFTPTPASALFDFLELGDLIQTEFDYGDYDLIIFVDFNQYPRIAKFTQGKEDYFDQKQKIIIDHHLPLPEPVNTIIYRNHHAISTCDILFELTYARWPELFDAKIATYLYMGLTTDSGNFRYDEGEQTLRTFAIANQLLQLGADKKSIILNIFRSKSYDAVEFMQIILQRMQKKSDFIYSFYDDEELNQHHIDADQAEYGLHIMQDIQGISLVLLIKKVGIFVKGSIRGKGAINCGDLAEKLWGGGHRNAAGFKMQGSGFFEKDIQEITTQVANYLEAIKKQ